MYFKCINRVKLQGTIKVRRRPMNGRCYMEADLGTSIREQQPDGSWKTLVPQWHRIVPLTKVAADSLRKIENMPFPMVRIEGQFQRKKEGNVTRDMVVFFDPIQLIEPDGDNETTRVNEVILQGRLGTKPHFKDGRTIISLATNRNVRKGRGDTTKEKETVWHKIVVSEELREYEDLAIGTKISLTGELSYKKDGEKTKKAEITVCPSRFKVWASCSPEKQENAATHQQIPNLVKPLPQEKIIREKIFIPMKAGKNSSFVPIG